jgi:hypothetical protein
MNSKKKNLIRWKAISNSVLLSNTTFEGTNLYFMVCEEKGKFEYVCQIDARWFSDGTKNTLLEAKEACEAALQKYVKKAIKDTKRRLGKLEKMQERVCTS